MVKNLIKNIKLCWIAFFIPIIALSLWFVLRSATGPYWQFPDPSYGYLSSSLSLIKGFSPTFNFQPGISVQILGGLIILLFNIGHSTADTVHRVLLDPEFYLNAINAAMIIFAFLTSFSLGAYVYRQTNDKITVLLSQLPVLSILALRSYSFYDYVPPIVANVSPEPLLISVSSLFNLYFLKLFFCKETKEEILPAIFLGTIFGLGVASKFTYVTFLILPIIVCRGRVKLLFIAVSAISCFLWSVPIIPHYAWMWHWIYQLITHTQRYGAGDQGFINPSQYIAVWQYIIVNMCSSLTFFAIAALLINLRQIIKNRSIDRGTFFLWATILCILIQFALIAKHYDDHYFVSSMNLFGPFFVLFYLNVKNKNLFFKTVISLCMMIFVVQSVGHALKFAQRLSVHTKETLRFNDMLHSKYPDFTFVGVFPMPLSNPEAAFFWGNDRDNRQADELSALYPKNLAYFYENVNDYAPYISGIYSIKQRLWAEDLIMSGSHVLFIAPQGYDFSQTPYMVVPLEQGQYAAAYLLVKSTEKQANELFDASIKLSEIGDFQNAVAFALESRELHYQPDGRITFLLSRIYHQMKSNEKKL